MESLLDKASRASRGIVPHATQEKPNPRPNLEVSSSPALSSTNAPKSLPSSKPPVVVIPDTDSEGEEKVARASPAESPQLQGSGKMQKRDQELQDDDDALLLPKPKDSEDESEVLTETLRQAAMGKALRGEKRKKVDGQQAVKESSASGSKKCMKEDKKKKKKKNDKKKG
uniref:Uncharacterized protein n=1 Tax=Chromera velia CCMP2878 TaxID=1169474 RepID=A0A0G4HKS5_9ALVE|eukprot:Cvel_28526.t1-p1 / transcript=Cvel_28526.t1 / gene=Cvel_28526 / organism=Chromera_velia_CCMP2878 / gene_product=hypothetical protein / transcript_product=hypothetical protein / location=Cvel_scaffold3754:10523-12717(+) / protein_length=169 / sequence_SO=supercontig / SO=protein_coding / is_pseudo=false